MIRVTVELVPHGIESRKTHLGTMVIANTGEGTLTRGNYRAKATNKKGGLWHSTYIEGFPRQRLLAWDLVYRALRQMIGHRNEGS